MDGRNNTFEDIILETGVDIFSPFSDVFIDYTINRLIKKIVDKLIVLKMF